MIKFSCTFCGQRISAADEDLGTQGVCPGCNRSVTVGERPASSGAEKAQSGNDGADPKASQPPPIPPAPAQQDPTGTASREDVPPPPKRPMSRLEKKFYAILVLFGVVAVPIVFNDIQAARLESRRVKATSVLRPVADGLAAHLRSDLPEKPEPLLGRPFVVYYLGGSKNSRYSREHGVLAAYADVPEPKTLILVRDEQMTSETFTVVTRRRNNSSTSDETVYQHHYDLWAVDLATKAVVAYKAESDPPIQPSQAVEQRQRSKSTASWGARPFEGWGNSVTLGTPAPVKTPAGLATHGPTPNP